MANFALRFLLEAFLVVLVSTLISLRRDNGLKYDLSERTALQKDTEQYDWCATFVMAIVLAILFVYSFARVHKKTLEISRKQNSTGTKKKNWRRSEDQQLDRNLAKAELSAKDTIANTKILTNIIHGVDKKHPNPNSTIDIYNRQRNPSMEGLK